MAFQLKNQIIKTVATATGAERSEIVNTIHSQKNPLADLLDILLLDPPISMRFSWVLGGLSAKNAKFTHEILLYCMTHFDAIKIHDIERVIAKQCQLCSPNLPETIEGVLVDKLFLWLASPKTSVSTKSHAAFALSDLCKIYPDLREEFELILREQMELGSKDFRKRGEKLLAK